MSHSSLSPRLHWHRFLLKSQALPRRLFAPTFMYLFASIKYTCKIYRYICRYIEYHVRNDVSRSQPSPPRLFEFTYMYIFTSIKIHTYKYIHIYSDIFTSHKRNYLSESLAWPRHLFANTCRYIQTYM